MQDKLLLANLNEFQRQQALNKFDLIQPFVENRARLVEISKQKQIPLSTLKLWVRRYRKDGLVGLVSKPRSDRGQYRKCSDELKILIEGLVLKNPHLSIAAIYREVTRICKKEEWDYPSSRTVYRIVGQISPALLVLGQEGSKVYEDKYDIIYRREISSPNEIWQADHCLLDIWLKNDKGQFNRPWLTVIIDDHSRAIAGYYLSFNAPCALHTSLALHQAIWTKPQSNWHICGIPDVLYTDNGSDFISDHIRQVAADIKMRLIFSTPGKPRGRGKIERFFETVNQLFLCSLPGYTKDGKFLSVVVEPKLKIEELDSLFLSFLLDTYLVKKHGEIEMSPQKKWNESGFLPRLPESLEQLDLLLLTVAKTRKVQRDGIRFQGFRYFSTTLAPYVGEEVIIRYNPRDLAEIRVYYRNNFLCCAICEELANKTVTLKDITQARRKRKQELKKQINARKSLVDQLVVSSIPNSLDGQELNSASNPEKTKSTLKRYQNE